MSRVCMYLPPFAGDYSGVCSALYEYGGMICIHDAAGCTGNYTSFDEPRWYGAHSLVFCTKLRKMDAVLGDEEKIFARIEKAARELKPKFIAIVGSPVPMVVGFDFAGAAKELRYRTGLPVFGFPTAGVTGSYKDGIVMAGKALAKEYGKPDAVKKAGAVNLLGITPLDYGKGNYYFLREELADMNLKPTCSLGMGGTLESLKQLTEAEVSLCVSQSGGVLGRYLYEHYGIPYLEGICTSGEEESIFRECFEQVRDTGKPSAFRPESAKRRTEQCAGKVCIIHDAVIASAMARILSAKGFETCCFTPFGADEVSKAFGVEILSQEDEIYDCVNDGSFEAVAADPLILELIRRKEVQKIPVPHYAVSSKIGRKSDWAYLDSRNWETREFVSRD